MDWVCGLWVLIFAGLGLLYCWFGSLLSVELWVLVWVVWLGLGWELLWVLGLGLLNAGFGWTFELECLICLD